MASGEIRPIDKRAVRVMIRIMPASFDEIEIGQVVSLGAAAVNPDALGAFIAAFSPGWDAERGGAGRLPVRLVVQAGRDRVG